MSAECSIRLRASENGAKIVTPEIASCTKEQYKGDGWEKSPDFNECDGYNADWRTVATRRRALCRKNCKP